VIHDHRLDQPGLDLLQHPTVLRPLFAAERADVSIDEPLHHVPASGGSLLLTVLDLPANREVVALTEVVGYYRY
jgi:hypothetical protein